LIENSYLGGLASWRGCIFTGPSWKMKGTDIVRRLLKDVEALEIGIHHGRVTRINPHGEIKKVFTSDGKEFRSLAVIIAAGIKVLVNERDYLGKGLEVTSMGYEFIVSHLKNLLSKRWHPRLVIVGSPKIENLIPLIRELNRGQSRLLFIMEGKGEESGDILRGWVEKYWGDQTLQGLTIRNEKGIRKIGAGRVLLDFNSYELSPAWRLDMETGGFDSSFIKVDQDMQTAIRGIFAAGDVTAGGYNSFSRAVSQGIAAGLSAYQYVYQKKFGNPPPLFAYRPTDFTISARFEELPAFDDRLLPKSLVSERKIRTVLKKDGARLLKYLDGHLSIQEMAKKKKVPADDLKKVLTRLVEKKLITFHIGME
jgi:thioredoxin reductase (NADPH)